MAKRIHIDFETRSAVDLKKTGAHVYANDASSDALCMAYAIDQEPVKLWKLGDPFPNELKGFVLDGRSVFVAHNAAFEVLIWNYICARKYKWPALPVTRFDCTMVRALAMGLPAALDGASKAVGMSFEKDLKGHRVMMQLCKPRKIDAATGSPIWWEPEDSGPKMDVAEKYWALYRYCAQDIVVERELDKRLLSLIPSEKRLWFLDQKINNRGVYLDEKACKHAIKLVGQAQKKFDGQMEKLTGGEVGTCNSSVALRKWLAGKGLECDGVGKADVLDMLEVDGIDPDARDALILRQQASKSSTAKLRAMIGGKSSDSRVRGCFQFHGAASTGRWAGRRIQLQNLKRPTMSQNEIDLVLDSLAKEDAAEAAEWMHIFHGGVIDPVSNAIRGMLRAAPGKTLIGCDFSSIEARVLAWLAGEKSTLDAFNADVEIYKHTASQIHNVPIEEVTKAQRLIGKVATLALGFQGGVGAFQSMAQVYFIKVPDDQADKIKLQWRAANPCIVKMWYDLERAAIGAVKSPGKKFVSGKVAFMCKGSFLFCRLPSGRAICYPYPRLGKVRTPWGEMKTALKYRGTVFGKFVTRAAYGGLIAENITQAVARDLLADALMRFENRLLPVVMHVHDEIVIEIDKSNDLEPCDAEKIMCKLPFWAKGLPVKAEAWKGERYRK